MMMDGADGTVKFGPINLKADLHLDFAQDVAVSSPVTRQKAAAAKQFIEDHYKNYLQGLQDRKERYLLILFLSEQCFPILFYIFAAFDVGCVINCVHVLMRILLFGFFEMREEK